MKGMEKTNMVMARPQQQEAEFPQRNSYGYEQKQQKLLCMWGMVRHCRNWGIGSNRRMEVEQNNSNLNGDRGLVDPNQIAIVVIDLQCLVE